MQFVERKKVHFSNYLEENRKKKSFVVKEELKQIETSHFLLDSVCLAPGLAYHNVELSSFCGHLFNLDVRLNQDDVDPIWTSLQLRP